MHDALDTSLQHLPPESLMQELLLFCSSHLQWSPGAHYCQCSFATKKRVVLRLRTHRSRASESIVASLIGPGAQDSQGNVFIGDALSLKNSTPCDRPPYPLMAVHIRNLQATVLTLVDRVPGWCFIGKFLDVVFLILGAFTSTGKW